MAIRFVFLEVRLFVSIFQIAILEVLDLLEALTLTPAHRYGIRFLFDNSVRFGQVALVGLLLGGRKGWLRGRPSCAVVTSTGISTGILTRMLFLGRCTANGRIHK